jgi:hypothetical protein
MSIRDEYEIEMAPLSEMVVRDISFEDSDSPLEFERKMSLVEAYAYRLREREQAKRFLVGTEVEEVRPAPGSSSSLMVDDDDDGVSDVDQEDGEEFDIVDDEEDDDENDIVLEMNRDPHHVSSRIVTPPHTTTAATSNAEGHKMFRKLFNATHSKEYDRFLQRVHDDGDFQKRLDLLEEYRPNALITAVEAKHIEDELNEKEFEKKKGYYEGSYGLSSRSLCHALSACTPPVS